MPDIAVTHGSSPYISAYPWSSGFGTKYANPGTLPPGPGLGVSFGPDGSSIAVAHIASPYISAYPWSSGFGTKYANPGTLPTGTGTGVSFSPSGSDITVAHITSPRISAYPWSSGFGTKYANPGTLPAGNGRSVSFSPSGSGIAISHDTSPRISAYPWSSGFGTKYANPGTLPTGDGYGVSFSPSGSVIAVSHNVSPSISAYPWSSGFGTKYANPGTLPAGTGYGVSFSPSGSDIAVVHSSSPYVSAYPWSSGFGTKYANPGTLPTGIGRSVSFSPSGSDIVVSHDAIPCISAYPWSSGFGTKYANPGTLPTGDGYSVSFSPDGSPEPTTQINNNSAKANIEVIAIQGNSVKADVENSSWYNSSWLKRIKITVNADELPSTISQLVDFPVYVDLSSLSIDFHNAVNQTDARDIRVTASDGVTELPREVVFYDASSNTGELHFKANEISTSGNTDFYIYYDNTAAVEPLKNDTYGSGNVWSDYLAVYHLQENVNTDTGGYKDSSNNNKHGTGVSMAITAPAGKLSGKCADFDGDYDRISIPKLLANNTWTITAIIYADSFNGANGTPIFYQGSGSNDLNTQFGILSEYPTANHQGLWGRSGGATLATSNDADTVISAWYHMAGVFNNTVVDFYQNGADIGTSSVSGGSHPDTGGALGAWYAYSDPNRHFDGKLDEIRIRDDVVTEEWVKAEYANLFNPSLFYTAGSQEEQLGTQTKAATAKADIERTESKENSVKASIVRTETNGNSSKSNLVKKWEIDHPFTFDTWYLYNMSSSAYKVSWRFKYTGPAEAITNIGVSQYGTTGTSPTYRIGLQADNSGNPSGTWLGTSNLGYKDIALSNARQWRTDGTLGESVTLSNGTYYHIVIQYQSGTINGSNYLSVNYGTYDGGVYSGFKPQFLPLDKTGQDGWKILENYGSGWGEISIARAPIFGLITSGGTYWGQTAGEAQAFSIYSTVENGYKFKPRRTFIGKGFGFYLKKYGSPAGNLNYTVREYNASNSFIRYVDTGGTYTTAANVSTTIQWIYKDFTSPITFREGYYYIIELSSTGSSSSGNAYAFTTTQPILGTPTSYSNEASYEAMQYNGLSYTNYIPHVRIERVVGAGLHDVKANIIRQTFLVSPLGTQEFSPIYLIWTIPSWADSNLRAMFQVQVDDTDNTFSSLEADLDSRFDANFEYYNGSLWTAFPANGVTSTYFGNQARVQVNLTQGNKFWRVRAGVS